MKNLTLALAAATLVAGIAAGTLWKQLDSERTGLADLQTQVSELESAQAAAQAAAVQAPAAAVLPAEIAAGAAPAPAAGGEASAQNALQRGVAKGLSDVLASPEMADMMRTQVRAALTQQFPDLAAEMRFTPGEAEKFMDLLARQASQVAGDALGLLGGSGPDSEASQQRLVEKTLATEREISRFLGNKYPQWQEYQGTQQARQQITQLRGLLASGPDALSATQSDPLIAALGAEQTRINREQQERMAAAARNSQKYNLMEETLKDMTAGNARLINVASSHLSNSQLERYRRVLTQQEDMIRMITGAQGNAARQGGAAP